MEKRWTVAPSVAPDVQTAFPELHPVILQMLWNRGVRTQAEMDVFLSPDWSRDVHSPFVFQKMTSAVERIFRAVKAGEHITVHGDYDADGVCGSVVLMSVLKQIGSAETLSVFLPHREKDGYGLSPKTIDHLHENEKTNLIVTVDCGISSNAAITRAHELGIDVIVCDHHQMPEVLPTEAILLHPLVPGETYPNKKLCGTGVAYKLACALIEEAPRHGMTLPTGLEKWLLDLVAIATVTDVMPLIGENRVLEKFGLVVLNKTKRVGLKMLLENAGIAEKELDTWSIGFQIGPRINAAGRMNHANAAYNLLMCEDPGEAAELAKALNQSNVDRQAASEQLYQEAKKQIGVVGERKILFAIGDGWPAGLAGLVAGKLMGDFGLPVFVIGKQEGDRYVGSGRSMHGFDVTAAMKQAKDVLDKFGGHPQACGLSCVGEENVRAFVKIMEREADAYFADRDVTPTLSLDAEISLEVITWEFIAALELLAPYGEANPKPFFVSRGVTVDHAGCVGSEKQHLRLTVRSREGTHRKMIGFRCGSWMQKLHVGDKIDVVYEVGVNEWNGNKEIQLRLVDLRKT